MYAIVDHILFAWTEEKFRQRMAGSAILRIGYAKWLSNIAIAMGNALQSGDALPAAPGADLDGNILKSRIHHGLQGRANAETAMVRESVAWALVPVCRTAS